MSTPYPTLQLADLAAWPAERIGVGLFGFPVSHSLSPVIHNAALAALARDDAQFASWHYAKFEIPPAEIGHALALAHTKGFRGLNITIPHKEAVFTHAESADDFTRAACAGNTLIRTPTGWRLSNTDGRGLTDALHADLGLEVRGRDVALLGAGGAARATAVQCLQDGARSLWIGNRGRERLDALLTHLAPLAGATPVRGFQFERIDPAIPAGALVLNATSAGLAKDGAAPIDLRTFPRPAAVYEMTYNPPVTALLRDAAALGLPHANGLGMLIYQGARSLSHWTGRPVPSEIMLHALLEARGERRP